MVRSRSDDEATPSSGAPEEGSATPGERELQDLRDKAALAEEYLDHARRTKADFINYQDRVRRERSEWTREAVQDFIRDFLPALDSFTWARFEDPALTESLRLVEREFLKTLAQHDIVPIATAGQRFDPAYHEAVAAKETSDQPPGTILEEVRRGWMLGDRVLRPAGVRIAQAPSGNPEPPSPAPARPEAQQPEQRNE